jgi:hypothetical protein
MDLSNPEEVRKLDDLLDGALLDFERWFVGRQRSRGFEATGFLSAEKAAVKAYIYYIAGCSPKEG